MKGLTSRSVVASQAHGKNILESASNCEMLKRQMVQRHMGNFNEHLKKTGAIFSRPILMSFYLEQNWDNIEKESSPEEREDFEAARATFADYSRVYDLFVYASDLHEHMNIVQSRILSNDKSIIPNIWRAVSI